MSAKKKMKRWVKLLLLLVVLAAVAVALVLVVKENKRKQEQEEKDLESSTALEIKNIWEHNVGDIRAIRTTHKNADGEVETLLMDTKIDENENIVWYLTNYPEAPLVSSYTYLLTLAQKAEYYQVILENASAADKNVYGLADPYGTFEITLENGKREKLIVGDPTLEGNYCYCMLEGEKTIYSAGRIYRDYCAETEMDLIKANVQQIYYSTSIGQIVMKQKGCPTIELVGLDDEMHPMNEPLNFGTMTFLQPYDGAYVSALTSLTTDIFCKDNKDDLEIVEVVKIGATEEELEAYGLGEEPEYYIGMMTAGSLDVQTGQARVYVIEFKFGHYYGENDEFVYFRQYDENTVYGVTRESLEQYDFNPYTYVNTTIFTQYIRCLESGEFIVNGESYKFDLTATTDDGNEFTVKINGRETDDNAFRALYRTAGLLRFYEEAAEAPTVEGAPDITVRYVFRDGTERLMEYYKTGDFTYSIEIQPGIWFNCASQQFDDLAAAARTAYETERAK